MAEETSNYAGLVKQGITSSACPPYVVETEVEPEEGEVQENTDPKAASISESAIHKDSEGPLTGQNMDTVKPYIPSYLAALKSYKPTVMLDGVPLKVNQKLDTWCSSTNASNSLLEPESASSWADDDDNFLLSIARSQQQKGGEMRTVIPHQGASSGKKGNNVNEYHGNYPPKANKQTTEGGGDSTQPGYPEQRECRWKKVEKGTSSSDHVGRNRGHQHGGRQGSNATENNSGNPAFLSGGRFDALANVKAKKRR
ncbi:unnamed protein product [Phytomonas sp. EM1]|nr:unnamed protein product [Phytomonas sp. EM1]|eukprot:CCW63318.1 unnamed protein product [Phytomonas sp. isolate EM1]